MKLLLFLVIASTAVAAPKKIEPVAPEPTISKADIIKTLEHQHELNQQAIQEMKDAQKVIVDGLNTKLDGVIVNLDGAKKEVVKVQGVIDTQRLQIADDAEKIAKYHHLLRIVCTILAGTAAFLVFELLKPTGLIGSIWAFSPWIRFGAPIVVFSTVFTWAWFYF